METKETWAPIPGFETYYEVSDLGNIRSLTFRNNVCSKQKIRNMSPTDNGKGYKIVSLIVPGGKRKNFYVHRLVATVFVKNPNCYPVINHKDHNRSNNKAENLEWVTQKYNVDYSRERMKKPKSKCKPTNTGEKYITFCYRNKRKSFYKFTEPRTKKSKQFKTLEEAIKYRNEVMRYGE